MRDRYLGLFSCSILMMALSACGGGGSSPSMPSPNTTPTPVFVTPTATPHATATPTVEPSSAAMTAPLVSGQPLVLAPLGGYKFSLTFSSPPGTTFPANATVTAEAFLGVPAGAPSPQLRRRDVTASDVLASVEFSFSADATILYSLSATIPGSKTGSSYTAETFDKTTGTLIATVVADTAADGTTTFADPTAFAVTAGHEYVTELFVSPTTATPTPTSAPTSTPNPTPTPTSSPAAPALTIFAANNPGGGVAEYDGTSGALIQTFGTSLAASLVGIDNAGRTYVFGAGSISELAIGSSTVAATYTPTSATPLSFSVAPSGEMVVAGLSGTNVIFDEWDPGAQGNPSRTLSYAEPSGPETTFALGPDGKLYVPYVNAAGDQKFDQILADSLTVNHTFTETLAAKSPAFSPNVMAATGNGSLYVGEWSFQSTDTNAGLYVFSPTGIESKVKSMDPGIVGIDFDASGHVYVASNNAVANGSASQTDDTAEQLSVYSAGATSLSQQISDGVPGVGALTVGSDGTAYLVQYQSFGANAPTSSGAVYAVAPGGTTATDLIPTVDTNDVVLLYKGNAAKDLKSRSVFHATLAGASHRAMRAERRRK